MKDNQINIETLLIKIKNKEFIHSSVYKKLGVTLYDCYVKVFGIHYCQNCNKPLNEKHFNGLNKGFNIGCCTACTNIIKYGTASTFNIEKSKERAKQTLKEKYGVDNFGQTPSAIRKRKNTLKEKYSVDNFGQTDQAIQKRKNTNLKKYGVEHHIVSDTVQRKIKENCLEKYGVDHYTKTEEYAETKRIANLKKYGVEHQSQRHIDNYSDYNEEYILDNFVKNGKFDMLAATNYFNVGSTILHRKFDIPKSIIIAESEIYNMFSNEVLLRDRKFINPYEIDILSHKDKLGIEYNGLMWHSSGKSKHEMFDIKDKEIKQNHLQKTELVESNGYQLFHIFENEWIQNKEKWKSVINNRLGLSERIYARKCSVQEIDSSFAREFCSKNHLQGSCNSSIRIGLFYNKELVSVMTFGKSRYNKSVQYELLRFCSKLNLTVTGGASKLLKFFERKYSPESIISYANRRWSKGDLYERLGFEFIQDTRPNYFYFIPNENILFSREQFQKHKLKNKLESFDPELTETQNMFNSGFRKIYDSGNKVYIKRYNK